MVNKKVLSSFVGKGLLLLNVKGTLYKAIVDFAEIRIPLDAVTHRNFKELSEKYSADISVTNSYAVIRPRFVRELKVLCTACEEHIRMLAEWLSKHGAGLVRELLEGRYEN